MRHAVDLSLSMDRLMMANVGERISMNDTWAESVAGYEDQIVGYCNDNPTLDRLGLRPIRSGVGFRYEPSLCLMQPGYFKVRAKDGTPTVMFDLDGVIRDFQTSWMGAWTCYFGDPPHFDPWAWDQIDQAALAIGWTKEAARDLLFRTKGYEIMSGALSYPGSVRAVQLARANGWRVIIATHQMTPETRAGTRAWLKAYQLPYDLLVFTENKAAIMADVYFEDKPENLVTIRGTHWDATVFQVERPWNVNYDWLFNWLKIIPVRAVTEVAFGYQATWIKDMT